MCTFTYLIVIKLDNLKWPPFYTCVIKKEKMKSKFFLTFIEAENILLFVPILLPGLFTGTKASLNIYTPSTAGITLLDPCSSL